MAKTAGKKPTPADAEVCMKLYDLRRESEMRKARNWFIAWQPKSFEDFQKVTADFGSQENAWFRQVISYWEMAASLPLTGAVNSDLFIHWSSEMIFTYVRVKPFLAEIRTRFKSPEFLTNMETYLNSTAALRKKVATAEERAKIWAEMRAKATRA